MKLKDMILAIEDREYRDVEVPRWNLVVRLQTLSGAERDRFEASLQKDVGKRQVRNLENIRARLLSLTLVDPENNERMFDSPEDVKALGGKSAAALSMLFDVACEMNGITDADVKELEKNSEQTDGD
jgi:hypothetical protein